MIAEKIQLLFKDAVAGDLISMIALGCFVAIYVLLTGLLLRQLACREGGLIKKLFWAMVLLLPVLGWMFYLAFYKAPPSQQFR